MNNTPKNYQDYVVFVESKSLRGRSKTEYLRQVRKIPYEVFFVEDEERVVVLSVFHAKRNPKSWRERV